MTSIHPKEESSDVKEMRYFLSQAPRNIDILDMCMGYIENPDIVRILTKALPVKNTNMKYDDLLTVAASRSYAESLKIIIQTLPHSSFSMRRVINGVVSFGNEETLQVFIDNVPPDFFKDSSFQGLSRAAEKGHLDMVRILFPVCHPTHHEIALIDAGREGRYDVIDFLAGPGKVNPLSAFNALLHEERWSGADHLARYLPLDILTRLKENEPEFIQQLPWVYTQLQNASLQNTVPSCEDSKNVRLRL